MRQPLILAASSLAIIAISLAGAALALPEDKAAAFAAENDIAMARMMKGMHVPSSGNVDRDFAVMMTAHHQGAVDMAMAQLRYGSNERLRRLASEIIVEQREEIMVMQAVLAEELAALPTGAKP